MKCHDQLLWKWRLPWLLLFVFINISNACFSQPKDEEAMQVFYDEVNGMPWDTLKVLKEMDLTPQEEAVVCNELAWNYKSAGPYDVMLRYGRRALQLAREGNYPRAEADANNRIGVALMRQGELDSAILYFQWALHIEERLKSEKGIPRSYNQLGEALLKKGRFDEALAYYQRAVPLFELAGYFEQAHTALNNIGELGNFDAQYDSVVLVALNQAVAVYEQHNTSERLLGDTYLNLGRYFTRQKQYDSANRHLQRALEQNSKPAFQANVHLVLGTNALTNTNYQTAIDYFRSVLVPELTAENATYRAAVCNLGLSYLKLGETDQAHVYLRKAEQLLAAYPDSIQLGSTLNGLGAYYYQTKQYDSAAVYYQQSLALWDSLGSEDAVHSVFNLALVYEVSGQDSLALHYRKRYEADYQKALDAQQAAELAQVRLQNELERSERERENQARQQSLVLTISVLLLLLLIGVVLAWNYRRSARLAKREAGVLRQETELAQAQAKIQGEEQTKKRIARDIHDELGNILTLIRVHFEAVEHSLTEQQKAHTHHYQEAFTLLGRAVDFSRNIAEELDPVTLRSFGLIPALKGIQNSLHGVNGLQVQLIPIQMTERLPALVERMVFQLIQETVGNVVKHAHATSLTIQLVRHQDELSISIEDNGIGFDLEEIAQRKGRQGMGLANLRSRVDALGGRLSIDSRTANAAGDSPSGTSIMIDLSLTQHIDNHE